MSLRQLCQMASLLVFAGLPLLQGCSEGDPPLAKQVTRPVKLLTLDEMGNRSLTRYPGVVEASERTDLAFRIGGELKELNVQAGQAVTSGERIALLDDRDARNALSNAQSSYDLALATYRRMQISLEKVPSAAPPSMKPGRPSCRPRPSSTWPRTSSATPSSRRPSTASSPACRWTISRWWPPSRPSRCCSSPAIST